jgi:pantothenate kinase
MISLELSLDGQSRQIELAEQQFEQVYQPVMNQIIDFQKKSTRRLIVGVSGPPGCGKTYFSTLLTALINRQLDQEAAVCIGMDGWHYNQAQLEQKAFCRNGKMMLLKAVKGAPESFDVEAFLHFLNQLHSHAELSFPVYDRIIHDPVENAGHVYTRHQIVIVEGNYLMLNEYPWDKLRTLLDISCFILAKDKLRWHTLLKRHLKGGKSPSQAIKHIRAVDMPNARRIGFPDADIVLERTDVETLVIY